MVPDLMEVFVLAPSTSASQPLIRPATQLEIFPVEIVKALPGLSNLGGKDTALLGEGRDRMKYVVKAFEKTPKAPASEWLSAHLAELAGIATARPTIVRWQNARAYGSRWEPGLLDPTYNAQVFVGMLPGVELTQRWSALFALDLFVHNTDRHQSNLAFLQVDGGYRLLAIDFSRAWFYHGDVPPSLPMPKNSTVLVARQLRGHFGFDLSEAEHVLDRLQSVTVGHVEDIFRRMPSEWLAPASITATIRWWGDGGKQARLTALRKELADGTYT